MYGGMIMEKADIISLFDNPQHPYTRGLMLSVPRNVTGKKARLIPIEGSPPDLMAPPSGCPFSPRCQHAMEICLKKAAPLFKISDTQEASCWLHHPDAPEVKGFVKVAGEK
jgi:oligopeptide transport system ATP-binding protein